MTTPFQERVYDLLRHVPRGKVTTYADLAHALGMNCPRAIGQAMRRNPYAPEVPCHRVVRSDGTIGGFMGETNGAAISRKRSMLAAEGVEVVRGKVVAFPQRHHTFTATNAAPNHTTRHHTGPKIDNGHNESRERQRGGQRGRERPGSHTRSI